MKLRGTSPIGAAGLLLLLVVDLWLLKIVAAEVLSENPAVADKVEWNANLVASPRAVAGQKPIDAYREIVAHPVFFKTREPYVAPPPPPPPVVTPPPPPMVVDPGLALGGIMIKKELKTAYLFSRAGANGAWTKEGEAFMGWKVVSISKAGAKLQQAGRSIDLLLYPEQ
jgi:hypothetical protein